LILKTRLFSHGHTLFSRVGKHCFKSALYGPQRVERLLTAQLVTTKLSLFYGTSMLITVFGKFGDGTYPTAVLFLYTAPDDGSYH
jgi:hypothetical protein